ncbi:MAG: hypothetical protein ACERKN_19320 [Velocimicrobium sp.]
MNIVVCLKQLTQATDTEDSNAISPYDMYMLKQAVTYKKNHSDVTIICLTMGPVSSESMLRRALSLGCDEAIRITDVCYSGSDTIATSYVLSEAIKRIDQVGAILCGKKSLDGETGFVGPSIAGLLNIPYLTQVTEIEEVQENELLVTALEEKYITNYKIEMPCVLCMDGIDTYLGTKSLFSIRKARNYTIPVWDNEILELNPIKCGMEGSSTKVLSIISRDTDKKSNEILQDVSEAVERVISEINVFCE